METVTVLFVDDERNVLNALEYNLVREPYAKLFCESAREALKILESGRANVVVSNIRMPEMDGVTLLTRIKELHPDVVRVAMSGFMDVPQLIASINRGEIFRCVTKPIDDAAQFRATIRAAVEYYVLRHGREELIAELQRKNRELQAAMDQVRRLEGMLPICSYCKRIRDDRDYWQTVEQYISERTAARFTHGVCPECVQKHVLAELDEDAKGAKDASEHNSRAASGGPGVASG